MAAAGEVGVHSCEGFADAAAEASEEEVERFLVEARAAARLRHPNIVGIHHVGCEAGRHYLVLDYVEGESLDDMLEGDGIPRDLALRGIAQTARAIDRRNPSL